MGVSYHLVKEQGEVLEERVLSPSRSETQLLLNIWQRGSWGVNTPPSSPSSHLLPVPLVGWGQRGLGHRVGQGRERPGGVDRASSTVANI